MKNSQSFEAIVQECTARYTLATSVQHLDFLVAAANCRQFTPSVPWSDYHKLYLDVQINRRKAAWDQLVDSDQLRFADAGTLWGALASLRSQAGLILTFHYGSFRVLPRILCDMGFKVALLMSKDVRARQEQSLLKQARELSAGAAVEFIDAEDPLCFKNMIRLQREGYHIVVYMDGNTGTQLEVDRAKAVRVSFLGAGLWLRKGLAVLSCRLGWPVHIVCPSTVWDEPMDFYVERLRDPVSCSLEDYTLLFYARSFALLEKAIRKMPGGWEGWLYPHVLDARTGVVETVGHRMPDGLPYSDGRQFMMLDCGKYTWRYITKRQWVKFNKRLKIRFN